MLVATCHCGAIRITVPRRPRTLTACNCSICRRYGALWAYYKPEAVRVEGARRGSEDYVWGDRTLRFVRCAKCGCVTHWEPIPAGSGNKVGVNARNFAPDALGAVRVRRLDGASTWKFLD
jgi:hypothetical protein